MLIPVLVRDAAAPMSVNADAVDGLDSTRITVADGALFVQVRLTWVVEVAMALRPVGAAGGACVVVAVTSFE